MKLNLVNNVECFIRKLFEPIDIGELLREKHFYVITVSYDDYNQTFIAQVLGGELYTTLLLSNLFDLYEALRGIKQVIRVITVREIVSREIVYYSEDVTYVIPQ